MEEETFDEAFQELIDEGLLEVYGIDNNGELTFRPTELGLKVAELIRSEQ